MIYTVVVNLFDLFDQQHSDRMPGVDHPMIPHTAKPAIVETHWSMIMSAMIM
jgi:hypothetical protein